MIFIFLKWQKNWKYKHNWKVIFHNNLQVFTQFSGTFALLGSNAVLCTHDPSILKLRIDVDSLISLILWSYNFICKLDQNSRCLDKNGLSGVGFAQATTETAKGQLISEWLFDFLNFPKKQGKKLMNFCPRI